MKQWLIIGVLTSLLMLGLILLMFVVDARGGSLRYAGGTNCEDAVGIAAAPDNNYGGWNVMHAWFGPARQAYITFDLSAIPGGSFIVSAVCSLYAAWSFENGDLYLATITQSWVEGTSIDAIEPGACSWTYREYDEVPWTTSGGTYENKEDTVSVVAETYGWIIFTCTDAIQELINGTGYGMIVVPDGTAETTFRSSEHATVSERPILRVTWVEPGGGNLLDGDVGILEGGILR